MFTKNGLHGRSATVTKLKRNPYAKLNRVKFGSQSVVYNFSPIVTARRFPQTTESCSYTAVNCAIELHGIMGYHVVKLDGLHLAESGRMEYRCELDFVIKIQWRHANERTFTVRTVSLSPGKTNSARHNKRRSFSLLPSSVYLRINANIFLPPPAISPRGEPAKFNR